jgi:hypothetical protein
MKFFLDLWRAAILLAINSAGDVQHNKPTLFHIPIAAHYT